MYTWKRRQTLNVRSPVVFLQNGHHRSIFMHLFPHVSINLIRLSPKKHLIKLFPAWIRFKTNVSRVENEANKTVIRRKFKELPTAMKLSDGSCAPALGEWLGGLNASKEPVGSQSRLSSECNGAFILYFISSACPLNLL